MKNLICCWTPSSKTAKSRLVSPSTRCPVLSYTVIGTTTNRVSTRMVYIIWSRSFGALGSAGPEGAGSLTVGADAGGVTGGAGGGAGGGTLFCGVGAEGSWSCALSCAAGGVDDCCPTPTPASSISNHAHFAALSILCPPFACCAAITI